MDLDLYPGDSIVSFLFELLLFFAKTEGWKVQ